MELGSTALRRSWLMTVTTMLGMIAAVMSSTGVNVAIPSMMAAFSLDQVDAQLMSTGFLAATSCAMLLNAWLISTFGLRFVFISTLLVFCLASIACQWSTNFAAMASARIVQGASTGVLQSLGLSVIYTMFPPDKRVAVTGIYGMGIVLALVIAPTLAGLLIDTVGWRYVFSFPIPLAIIAMMAGLFLMPGRSEEAPLTSLNWSSFSLVVLSVTSLLLALSFGPRQGWLSFNVVAMLFVFLGATVALIWVEVRTS